MIKPFKLNIPDKALQEIYTKVKNYPWHEMPDDGGWKYGKIGRASCRERV